MKTFFLLSETRQQLCSITAPDIETARSLLKSTSPGPTFGYTLMEWPEQLEAVSYDEWRLERLTEIEQKWRALATQKQEGADNFDLPSWVAEWMELVQNRPEIIHDEGMILVWFTSALISGYSEAIKRIWGREGDHSHILNRGRFVKLIDDESNSLEVSGVFKTIHGSSGKCGTVVSKNGDLYTVNSYGTIQKWHRNWIQPLEFQRGDEVRIIEGEGQGRIGRIECFFHGEESYIVRFEESQKVEIESARLRKVYG